MDLVGMDLQAEAPPGRFGEDPLRLGKEKPLLAEHVAEPGDPLPLPPPGSISSTIRST